jgi:AhpD family alkylhydroperoxidase
MPRIAPSDAFANAELGDLGQGDRINLGVAAIMTRRPEVAQALGGLTAALRSSGTLSPRLLELVRLRIAFHNQCRSCMAVRYQSALDDGLTEGAVCSLEQPASPSESEADDLTEAERTAVRFADLFATNHLAIDDSVYDELRAHFTEDELVELGLNCAVAVGIGRLTATWDVIDDVPDVFRKDSNAPVAPWVSGAVVATG